MSSAEGRRLAGEFRAEEHFKSSCYGLFIMSPVVVEGLCFSVWSLPVDIGARALSCCVGRVTCAELDNREISRDRLLPLLEDTHTHTHTSFPLPAVSKPFNSGQSL